MNCVRTDCLLLASSLLMWTVVRSMVCCWLGAGLRSVARTVSACHAKVGLSVSGEYEMV